MSLSVMLYAWKCFGHPYLPADDERSVRFARRSIELD
jgi:hypothetical protein